MGKMRCRTSSEEDWEGLLYRSSRIEDQTLITGGSRLASRAREQEPEPAITV